MKQIKILLAINFIVMVVGFVILNKTTSSKKNTQAVKTIIIDKNIPILMDKNTHDYEFKIFKIYLSYVDRSDLNITGNEDGDEVTELEIIKFFSKQGVTFPEGNILRFSKGNTNLVVLNTPKNIERISIIISKFGGKPKQIYASFKVYKLNNYKITKGKNYTYEEFLKIPDENLELLSNINLITENRESVISRAVQEMYFPTEFGKDGSPTYKEARDIGVILNITPFLKEDEQSIEVEMVPERTSIKDYELVKFGDITRKIPILSVLKMETKIQTLPNKHWVFAMQESFVDSQDKEIKNSKLKKDFFFFVLYFNLIDIEGKFIKP